MINFQIKNKEPDPPSDPIITGELVKHHSNLTLRLNGLDVLSLNAYGGRVHRFWHEKWRWKKANLADILLDSSEDHKDKFFAISIAS